MADSEAAITLSLPSKYKSSKSSNPSTSSSPPTIEWLSRTWTVTHSTLSMWRSARNVRITYKPLSGKGDGRTRIDDLVEYEPIKKISVRKTVEGIDTQAGDSSWNWRGKGWLFFVGSHWEVMGWGEAKTEDGETERWAVTWFAPTLFTKEGVDVYCDRREGLSGNTYLKILAALKSMHATRIVEMAEQDMRPVEIKLPWTEA